MYPLFEYSCFCYFGYNIAENYKYLHELLEALVPVERSSTICGWNNRGQLLWDYLKIIGEVDTLLANQDLAAGYQLEKLQPQLSGLCARINMLPCPTAMDRYVASLICELKVFVTEVTSFEGSVCVCLFVCLFVSYIAVRME